MKINNSESVSANALAQTERKVAATHKIPRVRRIKQIAHISLVNRGVARDSDDYVHGCWSSAMIPLQLRRGAAP